MIFHGHVVVLVKYCQVATLGPGETFGELGLQNLEKRTATVKVSLKLYLVVSDCSCTLSMAQVEVEMPSTTSTE